MADETNRKTVAKGQTLLLLACALLIGFTGGRSVAETAGAVSPGSTFHNLDDSESRWVTVAIALLALFVYAGLQVLLILAHRGVAVLAGVQTRPPAWVALVLIGCGMLCLFAAVALQWHESSTTASISASLPAVQVPQAKGIVAAGAVSVQARTSLMVPVTTLVVLLAGLVISGVGTWASIPPRPTAVAEGGALQGNGEGHRQAIRAEPGAAADRPRE